VPFTLVTNSRYFGNRTLARASETGHLPMQGAIRDCPVRLRLKDRVHTPSSKEGRMPLHAGITPQLCRSPVIRDHVRPQRAIVADSLIVTGIPRRPDIMPIGRARSAEQ
jgi:hypothetical protein